MSRPAANRPTDGELAILNVLWERGPSTVRDVQEALRVHRETAYTTALKMLQIMTEKGLVTRDETRRTHVYFPASEQEDTQGHLARDLAERAFGGSAAQLAMRALSQEPASAEELAEIRELLDNLERESEETARRSR